MPRTCTAHATTTTTHKTDKCSAICICVRCTIECFRTFYLMGQPAAAHPWRRRCWTSRRYVVHARAMTTHAYDAPRTQNMQVACARLSFFNCGRVTQREREWERNCAGKFLILVQKHMVVMGGCFGRTRNNEWKCYADDVYLREGIWWKLYAPDGMGCVCHERSNVYTCQNHNRENFICENCFGIIYTVRKYIFRSNKKW